MSLYSIVSPLKDLLFWDKQKTDSWIIRLNTKYTVVILVTFSLLVTAQQFIGDPIDCIVEQIPSGVMDTYCWIHSTFTLPHRILQDDGLVAHPGVGTPEYGEETTKHLYYQWVCFTLFFQALLFYFPKYLWNLWENGEVKELIPRELVYTVDDSALPDYPVPRGVASDHLIKKQVLKMTAYLASRYGCKGIHRYDNYFIQYLFCEFLSFLNVCVQIFFLNIFLGGMFTTYGIMVWSVSSMDPEDRNDPMNLVFPKVAKCTFKKFGPTGTVQVFDGLCVLPINILNEKIYIFLFFWFIILSILTGIGFLYTLLTLASGSLRAAAVRTKSNHLVDGDVAKRIVQNLRMGELFFLLQLGSNVDPYVFAELCKEVDNMYLSSRNFEGSLQLNGNISNFKKAPEEIELKEISQWPEKIKIGKQQ